MLGRGWAMVLLVICVDAIAGFPAVPLPPESQGEMVSEHMRSNGLDMRASTFYSSLPLDDVIAFYQDLWGEGDQVTQNDLGDRVVLGRGTDTHSITIELASHGDGTQATIGILKLPEPGFNYTPGQGVLVPSGTTVMGDVRFLDVDDAPRIVTLVNEQTPYVNRQFYWRNLRPKGWEMSGGEGCRANSRQCLVVFERDAGANRIVFFAERKKFDERASEVTQVVLQIQ